MKWRTKLTLMPWRGAGGQAIDHETSGPLNRHYSGFLNCTKSGIAGLVLNVSRYLRWTSSSGNC
jgi:hypothetical protein